MSYSTIGHKCIEGDIIEINMLALCNASRVLNDIIDISDDNISIVDEKTPTLTKLCLESFKYLCEMNNHSSNSQEKNKYFSLSKTIKQALPAIEKWDCPGLLRIMFDDINATCGLFLKNSCYYTVEDIVKYEELVLDEKIMWKENVYLFILHSFNNNINKVLLKKMNWSLSSFKKETLVTLLLYINTRIELDVNKMKKLDNDVSTIYGIDDYIKYY
tara:strand:- start:2399 stop:3046 length:648 start_codon:yes stop_codon:yes gene_type:complete